MLVCYKNRSIACAPVLQTTTCCLTFPHHPTPAPVFLSFCVDVVAPWDWSPQPTSGVISLAGQDVRLYDKSEWARAVSLVNQVRSTTIRVIVCMHTQGSKCTHRQDEMGEETRCCQKRFSHRVGCWRDNFYSYKSMMGWTCAYAWSFICVENLWLWIRFILNISSLLLTLLFLISYPSAVSLLSAISWSSSVSKSFCHNCFCLWFLGTSAVRPLPARQHCVWSAKRSRYRRRGDYCGKSCKRSRIHRKIATGTTLSPPAIRHTFPFPPLCSWGQFLRVWLIVSECRRCKRCDCILFRGELRFMIWIYLPQWENYGS